MNDPERDAQQPSGADPGCLSPDDALAFCDEKAVVAPQLRSHVERCERCRLLVAEAVRAVVDVAATRSRALLTLSEGEQVAGRYRVLRFLARGGMGEVYEAFDQVLQENVALKTLISTALDDDRAVSRLALEVRLARKVTHQNVCRILEFGFHAPASWKGARLPFLTMELLSGETLGRRVARLGPLPLPQVAELAAQMVAGLAAIHAAGIIHRDFKSDNAFLCRSAGGLERLVLMDFGLARLPLDSDGRMQSTGSLIAGTADYIAPEQLQGEPLTPGADIYALGVVLFELITGKRPFTGESPVATAMNRLRRPPPAPSSLRPGLPRAWDEVVLGCLQRQPSRRYARVEEVLAALAPGAAARRFSQSVWLRPGRLALLAVPLVAALGVASVALRGRGGDDQAATATGAAATGSSASASPRTVEPPAAVPVMPEPALLGRKWPMREIPVCIEKVGKIPDPPAVIFTMRTHLDFTWTEVGNFWFKDAGSCPPDARGMVAVTLSEGSHHRADLGYHADRPVRVHLGIDPVGLYDRTVHAFGRALGFGLRGDRVLSSAEITLAQTHYGRKPPGSVLGPWGRCLARVPGKKFASLSRCAGRADETWRHHSPSRQLRSAAGEPVCLGVPAGKSLRQPLAVEPCQTGARQTLSFAGASWRVLGNQCVGAAARRPGAGLTVGACHGGSAQRWDFFRGDERIRLAGSDLCVTAPARAIELGVGTRMTLEHCRRGDGIQELVFHTGGTIKLDPIADLCLSAAMGWPDRGEITLETWCDRQPPLASTRFHVSGTLKVAGGCLGVSGLPDDSTPVWSTPCVGGWRNQQWEYHF